MNKKRLPHLLALLCVLFIGSAGLMYKVYFERSGDPFVRQVAGWLPAARVGKATVSYERFLSSRDAMRTYLASEASKRQGIDATLTPELERAALARLMRELATNEMAAEKGVTVPDEDVRGSFAEMVLMSSTTIPNVGEYLKQSFDWTEEEYRNNIIRPAILEERVAATMTTDTQMQLIVFQQALQDRLSKSDARLYLRF